MPTALHHYTVAEIKGEEKAARPPTWACNARLGRFTNFVNLLDMCGVSVPSAVLQHPALSEQDPDPAGVPYTCGAFPAKHALYLPGTACSCGLPHALSAGDDRCQMLVTMQTAVALQSYACACSHSLACGMQWQPGPGILRQGASRSCPSG